MRLLHALWVKKKMLPHEYAALTYLEKAFVRASLSTELEEEARK